MPSGLKYVDERVDIWRRSFRWRPVVVDNLSQYWDMSVKQAILAIYEDDASDEINFRTELNEAAAAY